ncbi:MAG: ABC transporter permease [Mycoplasmataceae bacterium]|nr:ABC transporter permease [Mycoplasmataceae bacterium]
MFLLFIVWIFFVFIKNFSKNRVLNKSVSKSVFSGKLSLIIILVFYGISFSLIGGTNLLSKSSERTFSRQFNNNNIYQIEEKKGFIDIEDDLFGMMGEIYNKSFSTSNIKSTNFVSPWVIDHTLTTKTVDKMIELEQSDTSYKMIHLKDGDFIKPSDVFSPTFDESYVNTKSFGWSQNEWVDALEFQLSDYFSSTVPGQNIVNAWKGKEDIKTILINSLFDGKIYKLGKLILGLQLLNGNLTVLNENSKDAEYNKVSAEEMNKFNELNKNISFKIGSYLNFSPNNSSGNIDFEFVLVNDIDFINGELITTDKDTFLNKKNDKGIEVNQITYLNKNKEQFLNSSSNDEFTFNVIVQQDFLELNKINVGENLNTTFSTNGVNNIKFNVFDSVRFNEVTYPTMGINILPNKKEQTFIGMKTSDILKFYDSANFTSIYNRSMSAFVSLNNESKTLGKINSWLPGSSKMENIKNWFIEYISLISFNITNPYKLSINKAQEIIDKASELEIEHYWYQTYINNFNINGYVYTTTIPEQRFLLINELKTIESLRAMIGPIEVGSTQTIINVLVIIFMIIILIVLSMLIVKRVKSSGKQLGTLKAMGMKNSEIASAYIIFPMVIIFIGFVIASLLSPLILFLFSNIMSGFYYITFSVNPVSLSYFIVMLFIPMALSIVLVYLIAISVLRKPTLDLLTNKGKDYPNILVRIFGYAMTSKAPFSVSYIGVGTFRAVGKSMLLFASIFMATLLTAFAMSSTTMVKQQTANTLSYLNFESIATNKIQNRGQFSNEYLYIDANGDGVADELAYEYNLLSDDSYEPVEGMKPFKLTEFLTIFDPGWDIAKYNSAMKSLQTKIESLEITYSIKDGVKSNTFITKELMEQILLSNALFKFKYEKEEEGHSDTFNEFEKSLDNSSNSVLTFNDLSFLINSWLLDAGINFISNQNNLFDFDFGQISLETPDAIMDSLKYIHDFLSQFDNLLTDLVFGTQYYNEYNQVMPGHGKINSHKLSINGDEDEYFDYHNAIEIEEIEEMNDINVNLVPTKTEFLNSYGNANNTLGEETWNSSFGKYTVEDPRLLEYIPILATTQAAKILEQKVKEGYVEKEGDIYTVSLSLSSLTNDSKKYESKSNYSFRDIYYKVKIKVEHKIFVGVDFGISIFTPYIEKYFSPSVYELKGKGIVESESDTNGNIWFTDFWGKEKHVINYKEQKFLDSENIVYNIRNIKPDIFVPDGLTNMNFISTTSMVTNRKSLENMMNEETPNSIIKITGSSIVDQEKSLWNNGDSFSETFNSTNGFPISLSALLSQGKIVYQVIIGIFTIISLFAIFMSTTIVIIAMKDIIDSSKREVSMLKTFGYSNIKSTILVITPYLGIIFFAFVISLPLTFLGLSMIATILTNLTGNLFTFILTYGQWLTLGVYVFGLIGILILIGYLSFSRTDALEAIKETDE